MIRGPRPPSVRFSSSFRKGQPPRGEHSTRAGSTSVSLRRKVEDIRVEAIPRSGFQDRVSRLERALEGMGDSEGHSRKPESSQRVPLDKQIKDGEQFLIRAKGYLVELEKERSTVEASIADAERRLEKLRAQADLLLRHQCSRHQVFLQHQKWWQRSSVCANRWPSWRDQRDRGASSRTPTNFRAA